MYTAFPAADPIQEKPLEDEQFNLKTLIIVWYKHVSPQASNSTTEQYLLILFSSSFKLNF